MNSTQLLKFVACVLAFGAWAALVMMGKANPDQLVAALALTITGLGVHGASTSTPGTAATAPLSAPELPPEPPSYPAASAVAPTTSAPGPAATTLLSPAELQSEPWLYPEVSAVAAPTPAQVPLVAPTTFLAAAAAQPTFQ
ncbi:hypothetical protein QFZ94_006694 [Paraburkholderia sp. JPY465]|uniref:hypothetical protein n=1 Tax=Paraburkholderia sp. JPY465 TaxID=3042285 RepID=UPI003D236408